MFLPMYFVFLIEFLKSLNFFNDCISPCKMCF